MLLAADSQLLFGAPALTLAGLLGARGPLPTLAAAYLGASNGDAPAFFELFEGAMAGLGVTDVRHVRTPPGDEGRAFLARADLVLLAGGDAQVGWERLGATGLLELVRARQAAGAVLVGISAGALQLGAGYLALVPALIDVHAGPAWAALEARVRGGGEGALGYGIPHGGGLIVGPDGAPIAIRRPVVEVTCRDGALVRRELAARD